MPLLHIISDTCEWINEIHTVQEIPLSLSQRDFVPVCPYGGEIPSLSARFVRNIGKQLLHLQQSFQ